MNSKTDCVFLVADGQIRHVIEGFLGRPGCFLSLGCDAFTYEIYVHPRRDPGVYNEAHIFLGDHRAQYQRAVVVVDADWAGSPGAAAIAAHIESQLGGQWEHVAVIVIDPELEAWVLQDKRHVSVALGHDDQAELRAWLHVQGGSGRPVRRSPPTRSELSSVPSNAGAFRGLAPSTARSRARSPPGAASTQRSSSSSRRSAPGSHRGHHEDRQPDQPGPTLVAH